jgi:inosine-uridine nucleoside N-ribohydrolase
MLTLSQRLSMLEPPTGPVDLVIDTDAYNEIDDQFAIAYALRRKDKLNLQALYAAPFLNERSVSPADGMEKSYDEIIRVLKSCDPHYTVPVLKGSRVSIDSSGAAVESEAADHLINLAHETDDIIYVFGMGAITNVASAVLLNPNVAENCVLVWLGGNALHLDDTREFNMVQDIAASRVVMSCGMPFVQLPCGGVVDVFIVSKPELEYWLVGKNPLADYLARNTIEEADSYAKGLPWTRVIWDVTAVAWLLNDGGRFMRSRIIKTSLSSYKGVYEEYAQGDDMCYVYHIDRDRLMKDLFDKICGE